MSLAFGLGAVMPPKATGGGDACLGEGAFGSAESRAEAAGEACWGEATWGRGGASLGGDAIFTGAGLGSLGIGSGDGIFGVGGETGFGGRAGSPCDDAGFSAGVGGRGAVAGVPIDAANCWKSDGSTALAEGNALLSLLTLRFGASASSPRAPPADGDSWAGALKSVTAGTEAPMNVSGVASNGVRMARLRRGAVSEESSPDWRRRLLRDFRASSSSIAKVNCELISA